MTVRFTLELEPNSKWGMNSIYAGKHWSERKKQAQEVHLLVRAAIRKQNRSAHIFREPVSVSIWYNSRRYVMSLYQGFYGGDRKMIIVEVSEYG